MSSGYNGNRYFAEEVIPAGGTSPVIAIPNDCGDLTVSVVPNGAGPVGANYSIAIPQELETTDHWILWTPGMVATPSASSLLGTITGIRGVSTGTAGTIRVSGRRTR